MNIGNVILASLSYCAIIGAAYIFFYGLSSHLFNRIKIYYEIILGFIFGVAVFFATMASIAISISQEEKNIIVYWSLIVVIISGIFVSPYAMFFTSIGVTVLAYVIPSYVQNIFYDHLNERSLIAFSLVFALSIISITIFYFIKWRISKWLLTFILLTLSLSIFVATMLANIDSYRLEYVLAFSVWYISGIVIFLIAFTTDKIHNHAIRLRKLIEEDDDYYIASDRLKLKINDMLVDNKVRYGVLFSFFITQFDMLEKYVSQELKEFIWDNIVSQVNNKIKDKNAKAITFLNNYKVASVFLPLEKLTNSDLDSIYSGNYSTARTEMDVAKEWEQLFNSVMQTFAVNNYKIAVKIRAVGSVYGVHSSNINTLIELNENMISNKEKLLDKNIVYIVKPSEIKEIDYETRKLKTLNSVSTVTSSSILYEPIYSLTSQKIEGQYINYIVDGNVVFPFYKNELQLSELKEKGLFSIFFRFLAFKSLKELYVTAKGVKNLFLFYDTKYISSSFFSKAEFISKFKKTKVKNKNIVLTFDVQGEMDHIDTIKKNISQLKELGFRTALLNFDSTRYNYSIIPIYQPDFIFLSEGLTTGLTISKENREVITGIVSMAKKVEAEVVAQGVKSFLIFKNLQSVGINYISGELIGSSVNIKNELTNEQTILLKK